MPPLSFRKMQLWQVGLALAVLLGIALRLLWPTDIEYKGDEVYMFERTQNIGVTEEWPWLGMPSGVGTRNPGMSIWVFVAIARIFQAHDPVVLARGIQVLCCLALLFMVFFAYKWVAAPERKIWLWGTVIAALNPFAVLLQRKIWAQCTFPLIVLTGLAGFWNRRKKWGAFTWGLIGACVGQIHMPGFFYAAGMVLWVTLFDRKSVRWLFWLLGSSLGALPMIPWISYLLNSSDALPAQHYPMGLAFWKVWITQPLGTDLTYSLYGHYDDFLRYPLIAGQATYFVRTLHVLIFALAGFFLVKAAVALWKTPRKLDLLFVGKGSQTLFAQNAAFWGFGLLLTLGRFYIFRHYILVAFPLEFLWFARYALLEVPGLAPESTQRIKRVTHGAMVAFAACQFLMSLNFMWYIHANHGAPYGDYGVTYNAQKDQSHSITESRD